MKKLTTICLCSLALSAGLTSCDSWLDIAPTGKIILTTAEEYGQLFDNLSYVQYNLNDIAYLDDEVWVNPQVLVNGWSSPNLTTSNVMYSADFDRSENASGNSGTISTTFFQLMYQRITKVANTIIEADGRGEIEGTAGERKVLVAQAKAYRAFSYFALVNVYAKGYDPATAETDGGVPIRTDAQVDALPNPAKSSVAAVYALMLQDLEEAIPDLPEAAETPYRLNKAAGYALKAKIHLFKREWNDCIEAAKQAYDLNHQTYDLPTRIDPELHYPEPAIYANGEENLVFATTATTYFLLHPDLIALYREGLTDYGQSADVHDMRLDLYEQPNSAVKDYQYTMQYMPEALQYANNCVGLRTTEVMLMLAECYARKGDNDMVKQYMEPYLASRYAGYDHAALTLPDDVDATVRFVLDERRKELTMGYNRYFDLKRLNAEGTYRTEPSRTIPLDTEATPSIPQGTYTLPYNSSLYVLPFPTKALLNDDRLESNTMN